MNKKTLVISAMSAAVLFASYAFTPAPALDQGAHENNLKLLPKDISKKQLFQIMGSFSVAVGMGCGDCHAQSADNPQQLDFAADTKHKTKALEMMKMTMDLNKDYFNVEGDFVDNYLTSAYHVTCNSCHNGHHHPSKTVSIPVPDPRWEE